MENRRTNEILRGQIAIIQEFAPKLAAEDLKQLDENLGEIEKAMAALRDYLQFLPK